MSRPTLICRAFHSASCGGLRFFGDDQIPGLFGLLLFPDLFLLLFLVCFFMLFLDPSDYYICIGLGFNDFQGFMNLGRYFCVQFLHAFQICFNAFLLSLSRDREYHLVALVECEVFHGLFGMCSHLFEESLEVAALFNVLLR